MSMENYRVAVENILRREELTFSDSVTRIATMLSDKDKEIEELKSQMVVLRRSLDLYVESEFV